MKTMTDYAQFLPKDPWSIVVSFLRVDENDEVILEDNEIYERYLMEYYDDDEQEILHHGKQLKHSIVNTRFPTGRPVVSGYAYSNYKIWYRFGKCHRGGDKPAYDGDNGELMWYWDGKLHRDRDRPANIQKDGTIEWYRRGKIHRDGDEPAIIQAGGDRLWYRDGKLYRG